MVLNRAMMPLAASMAALTATDVAPPTTVMTRSVGVM